MSDRRLLEGARLDALQFAVRDRVTAGELAAIKEVREIVMVRIKLFGLDRDDAMPVKPQTAVVEPTVANLEAIIAGRMSDVRRPGRR